MRESIDARPEVKMGASSAKPQWYSAFNSANIHHPQTFYGVSTFVGREIVRSLRGKEVDLAYVATSKLTGDQIKDHVDATVKAHKAHGITLMPKGHKTEGGKTFSPQFWFQGTWTDTKRSVLQTLSYLAADKDPHTMQYDDLDSTENRLAFNMRRPDVNMQDPSIIELIEKFEASEKYGQLLPVAGVLYEAAAEALETDEAKLLARGRRDFFNKRLNIAADERYYYINPDHFESYLTKMMEDTITSRLGNRIDDATVGTFLTVVTGLPSAKIIRSKFSNAEYAIAEWRELDAQGTRTCHSPI